MGHGCTRVESRIETSIGNSEGGSTEFEPCEDISNGGVLFALVPLLSNGLLKGVNDYYSLPRGYYNLVHLFITLAFIVLLRIKSIESIKYWSPGELGKVLGLDRIPEIKTIRRKLEVLSSQAKAEQWSRELSKEWMEKSDKLAGVLYVDGHVRVYHGSKTNLPKKYVSREKLCLPGITDWWVNDALGKPFFVISTAVTGGLLERLRVEIIPRLLEDVPNQPTQEELTAYPHRSRFSLVFDREGYSPGFIQQMWEKHRISCYTYKKYPGEEWKKEEFSEKKVVLCHGEEVHMNLAERGTFLGKKIWLREIRKLSDCGHQTSLITTDFESDIRTSASNIFARWSQENFFKYMMHHFGIDRLVEYETTPIEETTKVKNPAYRRLESDIKSISQKLTKRKAKFGGITIEEQKEGKEIEKYSLKKGELQESIEFYTNQLENLKAKKKETQKHITFAELPQNEQFSSLANEKKHIMDTIKMIAYRAETAMANTIKPYMSKTDQARSLIRQIFTTEIDLYPDKENNVLNVSLHSLSTQKANEIAAYLCEVLNKTEQLYPSTNMILRFKSVSSPNP